MMVCQDESEKVIMTRALQSCRSPFNNATNKSPVFNLADCIHYGLVKICIFKYNNKWRCKKRVPQRRIFVELRLLCGAIKLFSSRLNNIPFQQPLEREAVVTQVESVFARKTTVPFAFFHDDAYCAIVKHL